MGTKYKLTLKRLLRTVLNGVMAIVVLSYAVSLYIYKDLKNKIEEM